ncbi:MAG: type II CRISPR RNA-guided endonuclease Cas9 [Bacteroidales bacterium]|nr:type II CRISPR RNA-guided endonuclease Cas9 [Bacteroidales bacterium]
MKKILGLDLGTNSIGWALIIEDLRKVEGLGSRIIPMSQDILGKFDSGTSVSQTAERTDYRGVRRLRERHLLRRERLHRVLNILGFLPEHYRNSIGWDKSDYKTFGKFLINLEPKFSWRKDSEGNYEFLFKTSFEGMLNDFAVNQPELLTGSKKIPFDWTIYYLRKKALSEEISKEELAWIVMNFNQKRGYYQLRGEDEDNSQKNEYVIQLRVEEVIERDVDKKNPKKKWYDIKLENGWIYSATFLAEPKWFGLNKEFLVAEDIDENNLIKLTKDGTPRRKLSVLPTFDEIELMSQADKDKIYKKIKAKTEATISNSGKTVGRYIYDTLLKNPSQKIKGKLVRTIERKFYKEELKAILEKQKEFHEELCNKDLYNLCINELYPNNKTQINSIANRDFTYLFIDDIIFYQRPLKSKKTLISNCPYEERLFVGEDGKLQKASIKCVAKSHPLYQEFRLWQFVKNIRIYQKEKDVNGSLKTDVDVTSEFLKNEDDYATLFEWLNDKKEVKQDSFLKYPVFGLKKNAENYRWNYVEDKPYPCNETRTLILNGLEKLNISFDFLTKEKEEMLWHILYSVEDKHEIEKALHSFAHKDALDEEFVEVFRKFPPFKKDYGSYSAKAIKKLLPLMRMGKYWSEQAIDEKTRERISKIINGECDEKISSRVREKAISLKDISKFRGLPEWLACYVVYNRHSEAKEITKWEKPEDIDAYLKSFKQHSLRNPIVEQVITETLRAVRDIWKKAERIDEIHIELGREMKNPADKRKQMTQQVSENENANIRVKRLLMEFLNPEFEVENVRPYSPSQQDILRIYEDGVLNSVDEIPLEVETILKKFKESDAKKQPTRNEILRYKLWLEQKYRSPYTGEMIPLGKLFTPAYEIEHVIPQSRYFDDSFSNKVICEAVVNASPYKDRQLGYEFIKGFGGQIVPELSSPNKTVKIFTIEEYERFVKQNYSKSRGKMKKLLMEDIPDSFIERQLNDSRYISKVVKSLLSNIVRAKEENGEYEQEAISKNLITCTGGVTDRLKKDWGLNDVWNDIVYPRFVRLNEITQSNQFGQWENKDGKRVFQTTLPIDNQKGFSKKRIDHRHHALDALVIACATRNIVNYLSNESANKKAKISRYDLQNLLCNKTKTDEKGNYKWVVNKPWDTFTQDTRLALEEIVVSFKQNLRVINKTTNFYQHFDGDGKKQFDKQVKGDSWAIRKPMHKDTVFGKVNLRKIIKVNLVNALENPSRIVDKEFKKKIIELLGSGSDAKKIANYFKVNSEIWGDLNLSKIDFYIYSEETKESFVATRKNVDSSFNAKKIQEGITDTGIQKILLKHLENKGGDTELAFSAEGIDEMNKNITELNNGKSHKPIVKVRVYEPMGNKFNIGVNGSKSLKFVETAKGTNLFFGVYQTIERKRTFETIPLNVVIERQKQGLKSVPELNDKGDELLFWLSPNDLVYVPTQEEITNGCNINSITDKGRIYKMVSCSSYVADFIPAFVANSILQAIELGSNNKSQRAWTNEIIKEICLPIKVDRLGNITEVNGKSVL